MTGFDQLDFQFGLAQELRRRARQATGRKAQQLEDLAVLVGTESDQDQLIRWTVDAAEVSRDSATPRSEDDSTPTLAAIPEYPRAVLPRAAASLVAHGAEAGLPTSLLGGAALAALAAAIGSKSTISVDSTWVERAILWVPLLAPRGSGKSPSQDLAFGPLRDHDASIDEDSAPILLDDQTLEALARELKACGGAAALDLDELAMLLRGMGEYKRGGGGDQGRFLRLWSGAPWRFTRVGSGGKKENQVRLRIPRPTLPICGGLQTALHELLGGDEDGLRPRWLPHLATMPERMELGNGSTPRGWQGLIDDLVDKRDEPRVWRLTERAREAFQRYRSAWKDQAHQVEGASTAAALVKADVHLVRVALVLAEAENPGVGGEVEADLIDRGAAIVEFTLNCWRALPEQATLSLSYRDKALQRALPKLVAWLEEHGGKASRRELQQARVAGARTSRELDALLDYYEAVYPGTITGVRQKEGRGLPTVVVRAPTRHALTEVLPTVNTWVSGDGNPHGNAESDGVATVNTLDVNTSVGNTSVGDAHGCPSHPDGPAPGCRYCNERGGEG